MAKIEVVKISPVSNGTLKAYVAIKVGPFTFNGCKIIQQDGQKAWFALPDQKGSDGKWRPVVETDKETREKIQAVVLASWQTS
mgnify:FL=1